MMRRLDVLNQSTQERALQFRSELVRCNQGWNVQFRPSILDYSTKIA